MNKELLDLTPQQLEVYKVLEKNRMAWIAFYATLTLTVLGFLFLVVLVFFKPAESWAAKVATGSVETTFGFAFKQVIGYLFPKAPEPQKGIEGGPEKPQLPT